MKAIVLNGPADISLSEVDEPANDDYGAIIQPILVSPCTSDVHTIYHGGSKKKDRLVLGHECIGKIVKLGKWVTDFKVGEIVAIPPIMPSWNNPEIQNGNFKHAGAPFSGHKLGRTINGVFAEEFYVPFADMNLAKIPSNVSYVQALMTVDMVSTGFTGVEEAEVKFGDNVAIIGIGAVGLMTIIGSKLSGASSIIAIGSRSKSIELAKKYGANYVINYKDGDIVEQIKKLNMKIDKVIICGGDDNTLSQAYEIVCYGTGIVSNVSMFTGTGDMRIPKFFGGKGMCGKTYKMSLSNGGRVWTERLLNMVSNNRFDPSEIATTYLKGIESIIKSIEMMRDKPDGMIKIVVEL